MHPKHSEFLSLLSGVEDHGAYHTARCPAHDDRQNSLSISPGDNPSKPFVWHCHAGCTAVAVSMALVKGMSYWYDDWGQKKSPSGKSGKPRGTKTAEYVYLDEDGAIVMRACRFDGHDDQGIPTKTFIQERPNGTGGWIPGLKGKGIRKVPYRLPELLASHESEIVYIAEGEKCVDRLRELGLIATCNAAGAGKWTVDHAKFLNGRHVVVLPDNDGTGEEHAAKVCETLKDRAKSVRLIRLPGLPAKGDVVDWIRAGGSRQQLEAIVAESTGEAVKDKPTPIDPLTLLDDKKCIEALGLDVFGEDEKGIIHVFSLEHRKSHSFRDVNRITFNDLLQVCGPKARQVVYAGKDETPEGMFSLKHVKEAIASIAGFRRVDEQTELGVGIWEGRNDDHQHDSILLVNAGHCAVLNGLPDLQHHVLPRFGEQILDLSSSAPWFDFDRLSGHVTTYSPEIAAGIVEDAENLFGRWAYKNQQTTPALITGLIIATWIQTIWKWRPQVSIFGKSNSGKTTLFEVLSGTNDGSPGIFGPLAVKSSHSSAAGIRQAIRNTAKIIFLDELEAGRHRTEIHEMLRNAGRGDVTFRGTAAHKAKDFQLRHIVWTAATESGLKKEPDKNRFISVELLRPAEALMGKLDTLPRDDTFLRLGERLLAVAIKTAHASRELVERLKALKPAGYHYRILESYSVPAACYSVAMGLDDAKAGKVFEAFLGTHDKEELSEGDEDSLLDAILAAIIEIERGEKSTVGQAIVRHAMDANIPAALERYGIAILRVRDRDAREKWCEGDADCVFVACARVQNSLLKFSEWKDANLAQLLSRLRGAVKCTKRMAGSQVRGVLLPLQNVVGGPAASF